MRTYYLDTNILSYCAGLSPMLGWDDNRLLTLRETLARQIKDGRVRVFGSVYHLEEASRIPATRDPTARRRFFDNFWDTVGNCFVLQTSARVPKEATLQRHLNEDELFVGPSERQSLRARSRNNTVLDATARRVETQLDAKVNDLRGRRERVLGEFEHSYAGKTPAVVTREWWADAEAHIDDWTLDYLNGEAERLSLAKPVTLAPRSQRTAWTMHAFHMARIVLNVGLGRQIGPGDSYDAHHFAAACYTDVLVSCDKGMKETVELGPAPRPPVITFDDFAAELGIVPS